jgi:hypothetical protein
MRLLSFLLLLVLLVGCQRYTIGAANAAPRVVGHADANHSEAGATEMAEEGHAAEAEGHSSEDAGHTETAEHSEEATHAETDTAHADEKHAMLPELENALVVIEESFAHTRGSRAARHEAAESLEAARASLHTVAETGAISHWEDLDHYFETAIEKVTEGTNDAPNALHHLAEKLEKAGKH